MLKLRVKLLVIIVLLKSYIPFPLALPYPLIMALLSTFKSYPSYDPVKFKVTFKVLFSFIKALTIISKMQFFSTHYLTTLS